MATHKMLTALSRCRARFVAMQCAEPPELEEAINEARRSTAAHDELVDVAKTAADWLGQCDEGSEPYELAADLRAALAKATP